MSSVFDQLIAVLVGSIVVLTLLVLQTRDRTEAVRGAVAAAAHARATTALHILAQDLDNTMSKAQATREFGPGYVYRCRLARSADDERTVLIEVPTAVRSSPTAAPAWGHVRYTLVDGGGTVRVGRVDVPHYTVLREVDLGSGYGTPQPIAQNVTDLDVVFRGRLHQSSNGSPPPRFAGIGAALDLALPTGQQVTSDQVSTTVMNRASAAVALRPPNLTIGA